MKRLDPLPGSFGRTLEALHRVAEELVAPARKPHNEIALQQTPGGFGTPQFEFAGQTVQVRVEGADLVVERDGVEERAGLESIAAGAELLGPELLPDGVPDDSARLEIDPLAAGRLADFYEFAEEALSHFRMGLPAAAAASKIHLWPEHFDVALEAGDEAAGARANYGASPGDEQHAEPYLYVGPWSGEAEGELWNATAFAGAELTYGELVASEDPLRIALDFLSSHCRALAG